MIKRRFTTSLMGVAEPVLRAAGWSPTSLLIDERRKHEATQRTLATREHTIETLSIQHDEALRRLEIAVKAERDLRKKTVEREATLGDILGKYPSETLFNAARRVREQAETPVADLQELAPLVSARLGIDVMHVPAQAVAMLREIDVVSSASSAAPVRRRTT